MSDEQKPADWFTRQSPFVRHLIQSAATVFLALAVAWVSAKLGITAPPVPTIEIEQAVHAAVGAGDDPLSMGWYSDADTVAVARGAVPVVFRNTPAGAIETDLPPTFYQWQVYQKVTGQPAEEKNQNPVGSCVGFGTTTAYERALACAIAAGQPFTFTKFSEESIYAISRVNVGGGRLRGDDGSVGGWAAKGLTDFGILPEGTFAGQDWARYDPARCRRVGDVGLPAAVLAECAKYKAGAVANLKTWGDAKRALANGNGVMVCSMQGFAAQRDQNGVARPSGRWGHAMCLDGYHTDDRGREYGHFDNSWDGVYHKGPVGWGNPSTAGFWADSATIARMLAEGDSWAISAVKGFPKQRIDLDWFTAAPRPAARIRTPFVDEPLFALAP